MWSFCAQHIFRIHFRSADDTDAHRLITRLSAEQYWMVAAERRSAERGLPFQRNISRGLECSTICILTNGWQLWTNLYWKLWALPLTRRCLNRFFFQGKKKIQQTTQSNNGHDAGATYGLTVLKWHARNWRDSLCHANPALSDAILLCVIPAPGIPTNWACCIIRSSWGCSRQAGAMRSYAAQYIVRNFC